MMYVYLDISVFTEPIFMHTQKHSGEMDSTSVWNKTRMVSSEPFPRSDRDARLKL